MNMHVILDNSSTHKTAAVRRWLEAHPHFKVHFMSPNASRLSALDSWFSQLERWVLYRSIFTSVIDLYMAI